jgi:hypothetical protein
MKNIILTTLFLSMCFFANAQNVELKNSQKHKIAVFAPLYLDSVFHNNNYQFGKKFPRFSLQGIDFIQGAKIALDSFPINNCVIETYFFDSKSDSLSINNIIDNHQLDSIELIIGSVKDEELTLLARFARLKKIPFISVTYPNDAGITNNPFLVILNSTLKSHCEAIFSYLLQNHSTDKILHVRQTGSQEDRVAGYFNNINKPDNKSLLNIKTISLDSNFYLIKNHLDSTKKNIIIGGSLDENFAISLASALSSLKKKYDIELIGMPNWEGFNIFGKGAKDNLKDFPIYYTASYFNSKNDNYSKVIQEAYLNNYKGKPSEYTYKGFESVYLFSRILNLYNEETLNHLNDYPFKIFTKFNILPLKLSNSSSTDYFENKHLYLLKKNNGIVEEWNY